MKPWRIASVSTSTLAEIFERAKRESRPTNEIADQLAEERISRRRAGLDEGRLRMAAG